MKEKSFLLDDREGVNKREMNQEYNQKIDDLERARRLREEAEFLEGRERARSRLKQLMELSEDSYYDRYLAQMWKDLESGKATPAQVEQEAQRSYLQYQRHMAPKELVAPVPPQRQQGNFSGGEFPAKPMPMNVPERNLQQAEKNPDKNTWEFKVGIHLFGLIGAIFVLVAFVIFGFYFLRGLGQGLCLYGAALVMIICSELLSMRKNRKGVEGQSLGQMKGSLTGGFSGVLTGIGVGGLYIANIINYLVLHTVNGIEAMITTLVVALGAIFLGKKKNSAWIRMISLIGCYLCFFQVEGFESELFFLVIAVILLVVNITGVLFRNQSHRLAINVVHMILNTIFSVLLVEKAWVEGLNPVYLVFYVATAFIFVAILSLKECMKEKEMPFGLCCAGNGILILLLFLIGNLQPQVVARPELGIFVHLTAEVLIFTICLVTFILWDKEDGRRWAQLYFGVGVILLSGSFSEYHLEVILSVLLAFLLVKLFASQKEVFLLDCIAVIWVGITGIWLSDYWYCWFIVAALFLSIFRIKQAYLFHEFVITASILLIWGRQCRFYFFEEFGMNGGWLYPVSAGILLILFLLFNHLPGLKDKKQQPYNIASLVAMSPYYLMVWFWHSYVFSSVMMVLGAATILIVFRKRYGLGIPRKYLVLAGFLTYFSLTGHYESPVIVSILLMTIALGCVGIGFKQQDRVERICGLVMAIFVCLKLVLYDFREVEVMYRMLLFLAVGVIALAISYIYVKLEKKEELKRINSFNCEGNEQLQILKK